MVFIVNSHLDIPYATTRHDSNKPDHAPSTRNPYQESNLTTSVLVTGGAGFIGSHLVEELVSEGNKVSVLDNFSNKQPKTPGNQFELIEGDVCDPQNVLDATKSVDVVYHLAAVLGVEYAYQHPIDTLEVEIMGTRNILEGMRKNDVKMVIYGSSSEVYGEPSSLPIAETDRTSPKSTYGVAKLAGERYCEAYRRAYGIEYVILRYFNVYGPRQDDRFVIPRFVRAALQGAPLEIYGDGNQVRDFTFVKDAVRLTLTATQVSRAKNQVFNVGTGVPTKASELADLILKLSNSKSSIVLKNFDKSNRPREIEIFNRLADINKAQQLGYKPQTPMREGIAATINWMQTR
ncbi:MAG: NAD-dependent epimerase/dehydratase family protein [Candidatus Bathyarchaeia archaeon]